VLSENFYTGSEQQSKFELAVRDHIKGYEVNRKLLKAFCELQHLLGAKERFYYIPLLILMIKAALKDY
ncbi:MAG TPA: hypothetical protein VHJ59_01820, partial [Nitrososphaera sp.]|nr:hypothetical protein [Nitrososphaera sp.]